MRSGLTMALTLVVMLLGLAAQTPSAMATQVFLAAGVIDFGAPSIFGFSVVFPLIPGISNPSEVFDSLSGTLTDAGSDGVTLTALPPPAGIPVDTDGVTELQVFTLSDDGGLTWQNVGLDAGPTTTTPGAYGPFIQGPIPTIPGGPWTHMRMDMNFGLSGGGDQFDFTVLKRIEAVPGAGGVLLLGLAFPGLAWAVKRRTRRTAQR